MTAPPPLFIFVSCADADRTFLTALDKHTMLLQRNGTVRLWSRHSIFPGEEASSAVSQALALADVIVVLCSVDYFATADLIEQELKPASTRAEFGQGWPIVVPILVRSCVLPVELSGRVFLPKSSSPIGGHGDQDDVWTGVAKELLELSHQRRTGHIPELKPKTWNYNNRSQKSPSKMWIIIGCTMIFLDGSPSKLHSDAGHLTEHMTPQAQYILKSIHIPSISKSTQISISNSRREKIISKDIIVKKLAYKIASQEVIPKISKESNNISITLDPRDENQDVAVRNIEKLDQEKWLSQASKSK